MLSPIPCISPHQLNCPFLQVSMEMAFAFSPDMTPELEPRHYRASAAPSQSPSVRQLTSRWDVMSLMVRSSS